MTFYEKTDAITKKKNSLLCVGLDPDSRKFPDSLKNHPDALFVFCSEIISATKEVAAAFKLNFAFFEAEGTKGWNVLERLMDHMPDDIITIADAKRADIGTSSEMYARAIFENLNFDAVTVNPYMGRDSVTPFIGRSEKGAFILGVTSNPGAKDIQHLTVDGEPLYAHVIRSVLAWNRHENCGLVAGATHPQQMKTIRAIAPHLPFLIPGVGTQGGNLQTAVAFGTDTVGGRALINSSRGILYKSSENDFAEAAGREAERLHEQINQFRKAKRSEKKI